MIAAIVAVDANNGIGFDGELLERIPEDMKRFKELTTGNIIVMGRNTWDSLPTHPLPQRDNIIISSRLTSLDFPRTQGYITAIQDMEKLKDMLLLLKYNCAILLNNKDIFIIGGGSIYEQLLPYCDTVFMTRMNIVHANVDTYFPSLDLKEWSLTEESDWREYNGIPYAFLTYKRV